ncbi:MAG: hypothetical protein II038_16870 [Lachnospiraceae bacterium]|nr:hypothetical protein [Lachnospiraceae bacterium]
MIFFFFFDGGMLVVLFVMLLLAVVGVLQQALPVISVILWIIFGLSAALSAYLTLFDSETSIPRRIINFIVNAVAYVFIGLVLAAYIGSLNKAMDMGGINGFFEFILVGIFGAVELMLVSVGLAYAGFYLVDDDANLPYGARLAIAVAALGIATKLLFF